MPALSDPNGKLPSFLPSFLHSFIPTFLPSFHPSFITPPPPSVSTSECVQGGIECNEMINEGIDGLLHNWQLKYNMILWGGGFIEQDFETDRVVGYVSKDPVQEIAGTGRVPGTNIVGDMQGTNIAG